MNVCVITESWMKMFIIIIYFICVTDLYCGLQLMEVTYTRAQNRKQLKMDPLTSLFSKLLDHPPREFLTNLSLRAMFVTFLGLLSPSLSDTICLSSCPRCRAFLSLNPDTTRNISAQ